MKCDSSALRAVSFAYPVPAKPDRMIRPPLPEDHASSVNSVAKLVAVYAPRNAASPDVSIDVPDADIWAAFTLPRLDDANPVFSHFVEPLPLSPLLPKSPDTKLLLVSVVFPITDADSEAAR